MSKFILRHGWYGCDTGCCEPPKAKVTTEWIGKTSQASIYTFKQGVIRCYVAERYNGVGISCVKENP